MEQTQTPDTSIVIPAFNEGENIHHLLDKLVALNFHKKYEVIIVDDGSSDNTASVVEQYPVRLVKHQVNRGYGASLKTGIRKSIGTKVITMDSDGQHDPSYVPEIEKMLDDGYDIVIGERTADSFQVKSRQGGKKLIRIVGEYLVEQKLPDYNSGLRGFKKEIIKTMLHMMPSGFSFSTTSTLSFLKEGYALGTFPIVVKKREGRASNVSFIKDGSKTMLLILRIIMLFNPLKIFFPLSVFTTALGIAWGIFGFIGYGRFSNSAMLITLAGILLFFIGLLADQIAVLNRKEA